MERPNPTNSSTTSKPPVISDCGQSSKQSGLADHQKSTSSGNQDTRAPRKQGIAINFRATTIDTSRLLANLEEVVMNVSQSKSPKTVTVRASRPREPLLPKFADEKDYTTCDWCFQIIHRSFVLTKQNGHTEWSLEGRLVCTDVLDPPGW